MRGFTLVELAMTTVLLGMMAYVLIPAIKTSGTSYNFLSSRRLVTSEITIGLNRIGQELALIPKAAAISSIAVSSVTFENPVGTSITYSLSGSNLMRNANILMSGISSLTFTYYDESNTVIAVPAANPANVRRVKVLIQSALPFSIQSSFFLINKGNHYSGVQYERPFQF